MLRPPTGGPPPEGGPGSGSGETKRRAGLLSQWRQAWRLKHRWEKQEGSPGGHSSRLTPCLPPRARGRLRAPKHRQHLSQNALTLTLSRPQGPPSFVGALEGCEMSDVFFPPFSSRSLSLSRSLARSLALSLSLSLSLYLYIYIYIYIYNICITVCRQTDRQAGRQADRHTETFSLVGLTVFALIYLAIGRNQHTWINITTSNDEPAI